MALGSLSVLKKYSGQWVAVWKNKIVGHGKTLEEAYSAALKVCKEPMVFQVPKNLNDVYLL